ncbi:MAG TPA: lanthionine synthetase LanC family protein, partial [Thermoanaerobaculia bacterium]|nr:lanthionine synthetase LanC family protein [Thermoanaerobaculia bacterium]
PLCLRSGAAGVAYAFYRLALLREDPHFLGYADHWALRARQAGGAESGPASLYSGRLGLATVEALVGHARGADDAAAAAVDLLAREPFLADPDLLHGAPGLLLAAALLLDVVPQPGPVRTALLATGGRWLAGLWDELSALPEIAAAAALPNLGLAHGWAGPLYATLRWCGKSGQALPPQLADRLSQLAEEAEVWGRGRRWRWYGEAGRKGAATIPGISGMPGWCNGSAGFVHLFREAEARLGEPRYGALARGAAWNAWEAPDADASLCCGWIGRAYALLLQDRREAGDGGDRVWLWRARDLARRAASDLSWAAERPDSLFEGELGLALLAADLEQPELAALPLFADEGWTSPTVRPPVSRA